MLSAILSPASLNIPSQLDPLLSLSNMAVAACEWIDGYLKWKTSNCSQLAVGFKVGILLSLLQPFARSLFVFDSGRETGPSYPRNVCECICLKVKHRKFAFLGHVMVVQESSQNCRKALVWSSVCLPKKRVWEQNPSKHWIILRL